MGQELVPSRPVSQSLFGAANAVEAASDHDAVADAVREASVAVEYHLDTLARAAAILRVASPPARKVVASAPTASALARGADASSGPTAPVVVDRP